MIANGQYGVQICGVCLIMLLMYLCLRRRSLGLHSTRTFFNALMTGFICIILDYATVWTIHHMNDMGYFISMVIFKSYMTALVAVSFFGYLYTVNSMISGNDTQKRMNRVGIGVFAFLALLIWILHVNVTDLGERYYFYGPGLVVTYAGAVTFLLGTFVFSLYYRKQLSQRSFLAIQVWLGIWFIAVILQSLYMKAPITSFCIALGFTVIFAELENPEGYIDRETGVFNSHALLDYMNQRYMRNEVFAGVNIILELHEKDFGREQKKILLTTLGARLDKIRSTQVFRSMSDEFIVIFEDEEAMDRDFPKLKEAIENPIYSLSSELTYSAFYILMPDSGIANSAEEIFRLRGFFRKHDSEQEQVVIDEEAIAKVEKDLHIRKLITDAINGNKLEVFYQPIYSETKRQFVAAEALARIREENGEIIMPGTFIPVAEESGLILHLGRVVFEKVCQFVHDKDITSMGLNYISVNIAVAQCEQKTLAADFQRIIKEYRVDPRRINLEITESGSLSARKILVDNMNTLIKSGVHFSLDDFGTGQSNLDYVMNMPVQTVKFDRVLTQNYFTNERTRVIFRAVVRMMTDMGLEIICEGVETREQYAEIIDLGVDMIQGFYFSRPLPEKEFLYFVNQKNREA